MAAGKSKGAGPTAGVSLTMTAAGRVDRELAPRFDAAGPIPILPSACEDHQCGGRGQPLITGCRSMLAVMVPVRASI
jgi:hypothetical protein